MLKGDIKPAVETHEMLYQVMQRHNFIPEAFTTDFQVMKNDFKKCYWTLFQWVLGAYSIGVKWIQKKLSANLQLEQRLVIVCHTL